MDWYDGRICAGLDIATNKAKDYSPLFYSYINASIYDIITGKEGHIWVSTAKNVIEFSPDNEVIKSYAGLDDTGIHSFERNACFYYDGVYYYGRTEELPVSRGCLIWQEGTGCGCGYHGCEGFRKINLGRRLF